MRYSLNVHFNPSNLAAFPAAAPQEPTNTAAIP